MKIEDLDAFHEAYMECALWSSYDYDEHGNTGASLEFHDLADEAIEAMLQDCQAFIEAEPEDLVSLDAGQCGHDFWLTRNGHGAGFWDRGLGELGDRLSKASKVYGSVDLYVGDDGLVYQS